MIAVHIRERNAVLAAEARASGATWVPLTPLMEEQAAAGMVARDGLHPSAAAYAAWADTIAGSIASPCP